MGNTPGKHHQRDRNKKYLLLKGAERPSRPGKPYLSEFDDNAPNSLTVYWDPPVTQGGTQLTGYIVEHKRTGAPNWTRSSPYKLHDAQFTLSGLEPGWRYQFRVFAENLVGLSDASELSDPLTVVTLHKLMVLAPKFTKELQDATALENDKVEFVVHFVGQPTPKLCWFKDGFEIFSSRRTRILTELDRSVLTIHQSAICDEGEVKCTATNKHGHVSTRAKLTLEAPPSIRLPRQYEDGLLFEINELVKLKVSVAGKPKPLVFWSHDNESIDESERHIIEHDGNSCTLRINEILRADRGEYQIKAVNKLGIDSTSFLVTVTDKPSPPGRANVVMTLGRSVTLSWNTPQDDGGCKIGSYIVEYYRIGWNVWLKAATTKQLSAILGDLIEGSEYKFRVKAESPFGVSEPSNETDIVFIPDPKHGVLTPLPGRGRSQPRDIIEELLPVAVKRKKPRSQSSPRTGAQEYSFYSPPMSTRSPEFSPRLPRKENNLNREIFDRESIYLDLKHESPGMKVKHTDIPAIKEIGKPTLTTDPKVLKEVIRLPIELMLNTSETLESPIFTASHSPSPVPSSVESRYRSPSPNPYVQSGNSNKFVKDRSSSSKKVLSRDNSENHGGSTEFMMVLYPDESKEPNGMQSFNEGSPVPPPLSFSAPELGFDPPQLFDPVKYSASSTELLHERAMVRFYQEALAEEKQMKKKLEKQESDSRRASALTKIQITEQDLANLERKHSLRRRRSAGGVVPQNILNTQKRHSLRSEFSDIFDGTSGRHLLTVEDCRDIIKHRQRSHSEEKEEEQFDKIRSQITSAKVDPKRKIRVLKEHVWEDEEYIESVSEDESSENETYHPTMRAHAKDAPFEILNKPAKLPEPDFIPKPILKKNNSDLSPPTSTEEMGASRSRSNSLIDDYLEIQKSKTEEAKHADDRNTSAIAGAGLTAAGIIISHPILTQTEAEESKSVIQHYGDIVRSQAFRTIRLDDNPIRAALKQQARMQAALHYSDEEPDYAEPPADPIKRMDPPLIIAPPKPKKEIVASKPIIGLKKPEIFPKMQAQPMKLAEQPMKEAIGKETSLSRGREPSRFTKRSTSQSKSPLRSIVQPSIEVTSSLEKHERPSKTKSPNTSSRPSSRSSSQAGSGSRSGSVVRAPNRSTSKPRADKRTSSPMPKMLRKPKMCEIMTQTSVSIETAVASASTGTVQIISKEDFRMKTNARIKVRNTMDYITDLAMFAVVLWVFLFSNELLAIPFLLIAVFRQLQDEIPRWIPQWIKEKWNKKRKEWQSRKDDLS